MAELEHCASTRTDTEPPRVARQSSLRSLIVPFVLTTVVGGALTAWYQYLASIWTNRHSQREAAIREATEVFNDVSRALDRRLYRTRRLLWAYQERAKSMENKAELRKWNAEIATRRSVYMDTVQDWNENVNRTYARTELYFGTGTREYLENHIAHGFRCISSELRDGATDLSGLERRIDAFNPDIYQLNIELLRRIRNGDVGQLSSSTRTGGLHLGSSPCEGAKGSINATAVKK